MSFERWDVWRLFWKYIFDFKLRTFSMSFICCSCRIEHHLISNCSRLMDFIMEFTNRFCLTPGAKMIRRHSQLCCSQARARERLQWTPSTCSGFSSWRLHLECPAAPPAPKSLHRRLYPLLHQHQARQQQQAAFRQLSRIRPVAYQIFNSKWKRVVTR